MRILKQIIIFAFCFSVSGCSGCSKSGIRDQAKKNITQRENNYSRNTDNKVTSSSQKPADLKVESKSNLLSDLFEKYQSAVFLVYTSDNEKTYQGSGFFINSKGLAVSNYHVFEDTQKGKEVIVTESGEYKIRNVVEYSKENDYIIFQVGGISSNNYLEVSPQLPQIGEKVWAISNPKGLDHTLSTGIVSGYRDDKYIQTTTEITHGSSGGALLNMEGEVVGITTMGMGEANLNFAVKIQVLHLERFLN